MVIDLFGLEDDAVRQRFPEVYQHLLSEVRYKINPKGKTEKERESRAQMESSIIPKG